MYMCIVCVRLRPCQGLEEAKPKESPQLPQRKTLEDLPALAPRGKSVWEILLRSASFSEGPSSLALALSGSARPWGRHRTAETRALEAPGHFFFKVPKRQTARSREKDLEEYL